MYSYRQSECADVNEPKCAYAYIHTPVAKKFMPCWLWSEIGPITAAVCQACHTRSERCIPPHHLIESLQWLPAASLWISSRVLCNVVLNKKKASTLPPRRSFCCLPHMNLAAVTTTKLQPPSHNNRSPFSSYLVTNAKWYTYSSLLISQIALSSTHSKSLMLVMLVFFKQHPDQVTSFLLWRSRGRGVQQVHIEQYAIF